MAMFRETLFFNLQDRDPTPSHPSLLFPKLVSPGTGEKSRKPREQRHWPQKALPETSLFPQGHTV